MSEAGLARVPLFAGMEHQRLAQLARGSVVRSHEHGAIVAVRGEPADVLLVVEQGALSAVHDTADGRRLRLGEFRAPCAVDKIAVLDTGRYTATWEAAGPTLVRGIARRALVSLVEDVDSVRRHVLAHLAAEVRRHQDERVRASLGDTTTRLAGWLVEQAAGQGLRVELLHGQEGLGQSIGASRVTTNRCLRELARSSVIRVESGAVVVLAPEVLAQLAQSPL